MMHRFCPSCGSLDMKRLSIGVEECTRCRFRGEFREGGMDEINAFRKSMKSGLQAQAPQGGNSPNQGAGTQGAARQGPSNSQLKEKLKSLKGTKTDDFEII